MKIDFSQELKELDGTVLMQRELVTPQNINQMVQESSEEEKAAMQLLAARGFVLAAKTKKAILLRDVCGNALVIVPQSHPGQQPRLPDQPEAVRRIDLALKIYQAQEPLELDPKDLAYITEKVFEANRYNILIFARVNEMLSEKK